MNLDSRNRSFDGVLLSFYDIPVNIIGFLMFGFVTLLIENRYGRRTKPGPHPFRKLIEIDLFIVEVQNNRTGESGVTLYISKKVKLKLYRAYFFFRIKRF